MIHVALAALAFIGVCALIGELAGGALDDACLPLLASEAIVVALMAGGMLGALKWVRWLMMAAGCAGLVWRAVRRRSVDVAAAIAAALGLVYVALHFRGTYFTGNDSVSHWALAAKYLIRLDRFPDATAQLIHFPSYPLGTAAFIYFFLRGTALTPGACLAVQTLLGWFALMPLMSLAPRRKPAALAVSVGCMLLMTAFNRYHFSIQVDALMAYMGVGGAAMLARTRENPRLAAWTTALTAATLVFVKSGAIFFSALLVATLAMSLKKGERRRALWVALAAALAFIAWRLHFSRTFGGVFAGKHDASLSHFAAEAGQKNWRLVIQIAKKLLRWQLKPRACGWCGAMGLLTLAAALTQGANRRIWLRRWAKSAALAVVVFELWYLMLFLMYVFSMPVDEAQRLASVDRYADTAKIAAFGLLAVFLIECVSDGKWRGVRIPAIAAACAAMIAFAIWRDPYLYNANLDGRAYFANLLGLIEHNDIQDEARYLTLMRWREQPSNDIYGLKYELFSNDIMIVMTQPEDAETRYAYRRNTFFSEGETGYTDDLTGFLAEHIDEYDYLLVYDRDPAIDEPLQAFLETCESGVPVCYAEP